MILRVDAPTDGAGSNIFKECVQTATVHILVPQGAHTC